jgi:hypothetical protein
MSSGAYWGRLRAGHRIPGRKTGSDLVDSGVGGFHVQIWRYIFG